MSFNLFRFKWIYSIAFLSLFETILLLTFSLSAHSMTQEHFIERMWRFTELETHWIDNSISEKHCSANERFFRGCFALVENLAKMVNPQNELKISGYKISVVQNSKYLKPETNQEIKQYWLNERIRYKEVEKIAGAEAAKSLVEVYLKVKAQKLKFEPFEVAELLNTKEAYVYDPYTQYYPAPRYDGTTVTGGRAVLGVGYSKKRNSLDLILVAKGSNAEKAGLKKGDRVLLIDGKDPVAMSQEEFDKFVEREPGAPISLEIQRGSKKLKVQTTYKDIKDVTGEYAKMVTFTLGADKIKIGYLGFTDFDQTDLCKNIESDLKTAENTTEALVLDLRDNDGGSGDVENCILGLFVGKGLVSFTEKNPIKEINGILKTRKNKVYSKPMVVLVNYDTKSSGELLAGGLKFYARALILGTRTYGKGIGQISTVIQRIKRLETSSVSFLPSGVSTQVNGVTPDIEAYLNGEATSYDKDFLRMEDVGLNPFRAENIKLDIKAPAPLVPPTACLEKVNTKARFEKIDDLSPYKDFQLLLGLSTAICSSVK